MHARSCFGVVWALALGANLAPAQGVAERTAQAPSTNAVTLGRPQPLSSAAAVPAFVPVTSLGTPRPIIRGQSPDFPPMNVPPPPPPPPGGPAVFPGGPGFGRAGEEAYNCGVVD